MSSGWLRGVVKEVPSGDTLVISATVKSGVPPEKRITLSSLIAPKLGLRDGSRNDEPFAYQSREFLRSLCIGQPCVFRVEHKIEAAGNREFGSVFLGQQRNVAVEVASNGWARVKFASAAAIEAKEVSPYYDALQQAESEAKALELGLWTRDPTASEESVRDLRDLDASAFFLGLGKGARFVATVEQVLSGSTLRLGVRDPVEAVQSAVQSQDPPSSVFLYGSVLVHVSGVQAPSMTRPGTSSLPLRGGHSGPAWGSTPAGGGVGGGVVSSGADTESSISNAVESLSINPSNSNSTTTTTTTTTIPTSIPTSDPFAREAKFLTETHALNRDVRLIAEGLDRNGNLYVTVLTPALPPRPTPSAGQGEGGEGVEVVRDGDGYANLAEMLLKKGLAKCVESGLGLLSTPGAGLKYREWERLGRDSRQGVWVNFAGVNGAVNGAVNGVANGPAKGTWIRGRVVEVSSGDCLVIRPFAPTPTTTTTTTTASEKRIQLSSIRAPRPPTRNAPQGEPWGYEARELLRKTAVGKWVEARVEYCRSVPLSPEDASATRQLVFANVEVLAPEEQIQVDVTGQWPASPAPSTTAITPNRIHLAELVLKKGLAQTVRHRTDEERSALYDHLQAVEEVARSSRIGLSAKQAPPTPRINDLSQAGAAKAKLHLPFLQRSGRIMGVVDFVLSAQRVKLFVPKEGVLIAFAPSGVKTPTRAMPAQGGKPATQAEAYAEEAYAFSRELLNQRDVEVVIEDMDRGGTFLGSLKVLGGGGGGGGRGGGGGGRGGGRQERQEQGERRDFAVELLRNGFAKIQPYVDPMALANGAEMVQAERSAKEARKRIFEN
eukprot:CAMPEP_0175065674 /NCGR_PEP_ID=MMETSP0052_2-20121109/16068_1 /TAXON_ID=51329 ORGANISM="Polytomella parva, Strain SAG 63-3" /NCGR_SAMPLE_ID=MMETSP0052_2 /ASSEMBLY_ACC=CAM_ASM_000194 /LENGTH=832 /DNA_ID=CAMNT_0016332259 /DNA_START=106 /DNA_END=2601 /DNA_ORIENTATION=-